MSKNKLHITSQVPTLEQMNQYLKGELTDAERKAMEEAMKDDPFLEEAMEGLNLVEEGEDVRAAVKRIKSESFKRINIKDKRREQLGKRRSRVGPQNYTTLIISSAAAITLLLVSVFLIQQRSAPSESVAMAQQESAPAAREDALSDKTLPSSEAQNELKVRAGAENSSVEDDDEPFAKSQFTEKRESSVPTGKNISDERNNTSADNEDVESEQDVIEEAFKEENVVTIRIFFNIRGE